MAKQAIVTKDSLQQMLNNPNPAYVIAVIGRALVVLFNNQTRDEQSLNQTTNDNGIGFCGADARSGSITAKYFIKHKTLLPWQVELWTKVGSTGYSRLCKYHAQLNAAAAERQEKEV